MVQFFHSLTNLISQTLEIRMKKFVTTVDGDRELAKVMPGFTMDSLLRDQLLESASTAGQAAFVVETLTNVYGQVSKKYLTPSLVKLGRLCQFDPKTESALIDKAKRELDNTVEESKKLINEKVQEHLDSIGSSITLRIEEFEKLQQLLPPLPPKVAKQIEDAASSAKQQVEKEKEETKEPSLDAYI